MHPESMEWGKIMYYVIPLIDVSRSIFLWHNRKQTAVSLHQNILNWNLRRFACFA